MKLNSKYFDRIRVKPDQDRLRQEKQPACEWRGCSAPGMHKAPKGRGFDRQFLLFCLDHVREYNKSYNYFSGMSDTDVGAYQKSALTGHRPTWTLGHKSRTQGKTGKDRDKSSNRDRHFADSFDLFGEAGEGGGKIRRQVRNAERKALSALGLDETAQAKEIKHQYKQMVKRHHPDANGGGKAAEEKLREIIQAYDYLKRIGFC